MQIDLSRPPELRFLKSDVQANPLLLYMTECIKKGLPCSLVKRGDGETLCMNGARGANCDGHPYGPELAWKLRMAFSTLEKMSAPRQGRTWVNVVPFEDQPFFNCLLARHDSNLDAVKAFWGAVRQSDAPKVFVGPERLRPVAGMLKADFVEVPLVNAFAEYERIKAILMAKLVRGGIYVFSAGFVSKVLIAEMLTVNQEISAIDGGSCFDSLIVGQTRTEQLPKWLLEREYKEWMEGGEAT